MEATRKDEFIISTFEDIVRALRLRPDWAEEMRKLVLTEELVSLPVRFEEFRKKEFRPLKEKVDKIEKDVGEVKEDVGGLKKDMGEVKRDVEVLKQDVEVLKQDVEVLKQDVEGVKKDVETLKIDVASLKGSDFERRVREKAPAYLGKLIRRCRVVSFEDLADRLEDAIDRGSIAEKDKDDALLIDLVAKGKLRTGKEIMLAVEVSLKVDVEDVERASKRADIISTACDIETIGVTIGKEYSERAKISAEELAVLTV
ncbi:MAG: hypothetical protein D6726_05470 [Nitrospirae bacterium]|nr:MAG: hypothetical protein D6726_05470 [Nitrospirota bacterium]